MKTSSFGNVLRFISLLQIVLVGFLSIVGSGGGGGGDGGGGGNEPGTLQFSSATYAATEGTDTAITITVTRTDGSDTAVSVGYATADGTATSSGDYTTTNGTLNWADGDSASKSFDITITNDNSEESAESFTVNLSNVVGASLGAISSATINITDDDSPGILQFSDASYSVSESASTVTITVTRTSGDRGTVSVDYATSDNTARVQDGDYDSASGTLTWNDADTSSKTFDVTVNEDNTLELTEAFNVTLSNVVNATVGTNSSAVVSILDNDSISINGRVLAPGGILSFKQPGTLQHMFALIFGKELNAAISDVVSPVTGAIVSVYEVDADGVLVSPTPISTTTTDSFGEYSLAAPTDAPAVKYIVRANGSTEDMDSRIIGTQIDVDPSTDATSRLVTSIATSLADFTINEVNEMQQDVEELIPYIDTTGANATQLSDGLYDQATRAVGQYNILTSKVSSGQICGHVQSLGGAALTDIEIVVRDFDSWTARAKTTTNDSGDYCVNVPPQGGYNPDTGAQFSGEYILFALNGTDDSIDSDRSASEWWSTGGASYTRFDAEKIIVANTTPVTGKDFQLALGSRFTGSVTASDTSANLEGVSVVISDFASGTTMARARVEQDGTYRVNVIPGTYIVEANNRTLQPYGSEINDGNTGTNNTNLGIPVTVATGAEQTINFVLEPGYQLTGTVTDGATSDPVLNARVKIDLAGDATSDGESTDRLGYYHLWLKPDTYDVYAYGQSSKAVNLTTASANVDFSATVGRISGRLLDNSSNPVNYAKVRLYDATGNFIGLEVCDNNGLFVAYTNQAGNNLLEARIDRVSTAGSIINIDHTRLLSGDAINIALVGDTIVLGDRSLPIGGVLTGHVYSDSSTSVSPQAWANFRIQVRDDDDLTTAGSGNTPDDRFLNFRTRSDGSYVMSLPAGIYDRVKMTNATGSGNCDAITIVAGGTTVLNFYDGDNVCEVNP